MKEVHCSGCERFLCLMAFGEIEIKCPKCKHVNKVVVKTYTKMLTQQPEKATITT